MEPLPRGANFQRAKLLWEIGLHIAGDPNTPYYGPRDMCITVGSGSGENLSRGCACPPARRSWRTRFAAAIWKWRWSIRRVF